MANNSSVKCLLLVLNSLYIIVGAALAAASLWFFVQVYEITSLRNSNHYMLNYNVYWPQAIPWIFFVVAVLVIGVAALGIKATKKGSRGVLLLYSVFLGVVVLLLLAAAAMSLALADSKSTDDFFKDAIWDVFLQTNDKPETALAYGNIERKLHCCGAESPRDYKIFKYDFPTSCCDVFYHGWLSPYSIDCDITNKLANERHGCTEVASHYSRIVIKVFSGVSILLAVVGIMAVVAAVTLSRSLKNKRRVLSARVESESKKELL